MIQYFAQSHVGLVRTGNEDSYYAPGKGMGKDPQFFMCVADGLGGHNAGEIASQLAVRTLVTSMQTMEGKNAMLDHPFETMQQLFFQTNDKIHMLAGESEKLYGMGTTLTAAVCTQKIYLFGPCRRQPRVFADKGRPGADYHRPYLCAKPHSKRAAYGKGRAISSLSACYHPRSGHRAVFGSGFFRSALDFGRYASSLQRRAYQYGD